MRLKRERNFFIAACVTPRMSLKKKAHTKSFKRNE